MGARRELDLERYRNECQWKRCKATHSDVVIGPVGLCLHHWVIACDLSNETPGGVLACDEVLARLRVDPDKIARMMQRAG